MYDALWYPGIVSRVLPQRDAVAIHFLGYNSLWFDEASAVFSSLSFPATREMDDCVRHPFLPPLDKREMDNTAHYHPPTHTHPAAPPASDSPTRTAQEIALDSGRLRVPSADAPRPLDWRHALTVGDTCVACMLSPSLSYTHTLEANGMEKPTRHSHTPRPHTPTPLPPSIRVEARHPDDARRWLPGEIAEVNPATGHVLVRCPTALHVSRSVRLCAAVAMSGCRKREEERAR